MASPANELRSLLIQPRESLDFELKQWIDPNSPEGTAKIARGCIALRNNNGGRFVIGFRDDGQPDVGNAPPDVRAVFHGDTIQSIVSKYSAEAFPVDVQFVDLDGQTYPVLIVPSGVRTPVAAKSDLPGGAGGKPLIRDHAVYVRSLNSNQTVSSTEARRGDWDRLTRICFDNREADIGGFVRRHLAALNIDALLALVPTLASPSTPPSTTERVLAELNHGRNRLDSAVRRRRIALPDIGFRESVIIIDGDVRKQSPTESYLNNLLRNAPRHTGWSPWVQLTSGSNQARWPYVSDDGWEAMVDFLDPATTFISPHLDFWRIELRGMFYHLRALEDDLLVDRLPRPRTALDFLLQVSRTAEVISTGLSFARSLGCDESKTSLIFGFRWSKLEGRHLTSWVEPGRFFDSRGPANQDSITTTLVVPLETPPAGIAPHVENAVRDLFALFGGMEFHSRVLEQIVNQTVERRM